MKTDSRVKPFVHKYGKQLYVLMFINDGADENDFILDIPESEYSDILAIDFNVAMKENIKTLKEKGLVGFETDEFDFKSPIQCIWTTVIDGVPTISEKQEGFQYLISELDFMNIDDCIDDWIERHHVRFCLSK